MTRKEIKLEFEAEERQYHSGQWKMYFLVINGVRQDYCGSHESDDAFIGELGKAISVLIHPPV